MLPGRGECEHNFRKGSQRLSSFYEEKVLFQNKIFLNIFKIKKKIENLKKIFRNCLAYLEKFLRSYRKKCEKN